MTRNVPSSVGIPGAPCIRRSLTARAVDALEITIDEQPVAIATAKCSVDDSGNATLNLKVGDCQAGRFQLRSRWLALLPAGHRQFDTIQNVKGEMLIQRLLSANSDSVSIELPKAGSAAADPFVGTSFVDFLCLGLKHILIGYDHLLFLFSLLIVTRSLRFVRPVPSDAQ